MQDAKVRYEELFIVECSDDDASLKNQYGLFSNPFFLIASCKGLLGRII